MNVATLRKGWCPGVLRPMPAGDGLLVRLRITAGAVNSHMAQAIAALAAEHGNGEIDLTQRANLQLRGVREECLPELTVALADRGLLDPTSQAEAVRNVMVSPLAGIDPDCADGVAMARELESRLRSDIALQTLPAKFAFAVDGGGRWPLGDTGADIALMAASSGQFWRVGLGGSSLVSRPIGMDGAISVVIRLAGTFLANGSKQGLRRMRDLVARDGATAIFATAGIAVAEPGGHGYQPVLPDAGCHQLNAAATIAAIGLPFGRIEAAQLDRLAVAAGPEASIRLTPWRLLAVSCSNEAAAIKLLAAAASENLVASASDPRLAIDACTGSPGCANASTPARKDAAQIASDLPGSMFRRGTIHVSGCAKGCAHRGAAPVTLVGRDGFYDLILNGGPADHPVETGIVTTGLANAVAGALARLESLA